MDVLRSHIDDAVLVKPSDILTNLSVLTKTCRLQQCEYRDP